MKLQGWEAVGSADEYREMIKAEYYRLKKERRDNHQAAGLEEVKLRLFLSLLDKPKANAADKSLGAQPSVSTGIDTATSLSA